MTSEDLRKFVSERGLNVKDCRLLTTSANAKTLSYKIIISSEDIDMATNNARIWPVGVGLRRFKHFNNQKTGTYGGQTRARYKFIKGKDVRNNVFRPLVHDIHESQVRLQTDRRSKKSKSVSFADDLWLRPRNQQLE